MILNCHFKELNSPLFVPQDDKKGGKEEQPILILNHHSGLTISVLFG
jgi:hypothetical protein